MKSLYYRETGTGEPLLILHGLFGSSDNWMGISKNLAESFQVFTIDLRNHGKSFHHSDFSYGAMSNDIFKFIEEKGLSNISILGHSMGGKVSMKLAVDHAELIKRLIVVDIAPKYYPVHHEKIIHGLKSIPISSISSRSEADQQLSSYILEPGVRQFLLKNLHRSGNGFDWKMNLDIISDNIEKVGESLNDNEVFSGDTLFIRGDKSNYILDSDSNMINEHFPNNEVVTISNAGHWVHAENPGEFVEVVYEFLSN